MTLDRTRRSGLAGEGKVYWGPIVAERREIGLKTIVKRQHTVRLEQATSAVASLGPALQSLISGPRPATDLLCGSPGDGVKREEKDTRSHYGWVRTDAGEAKRSSPPVVSDGGKGACVAGVMAPCRSAVRWLDVALRRMMAQRTDLAVEARARLRIGVQVLARLGTGKSGRKRMEDEFVRGQAGGGEQNDDSVWIEGPEKMGRARKGSIRLEGRGSEVWRSVQGDRERPAVKTHSGCGRGAAVPTAPG